jgi:hypothetical protein
MSAAIKGVFGYALAGLLAIGAVALWSAVPSPGHAADQQRPQQLQTQLNTQISWGAAGGCVQNIATNDFGSLTPSLGTDTLGPFDASPHASASTDEHGSHVWVGCVTTNGALGVSAQAVHDMTDGDGHVLPLSDVAIGLTNQPGGHAPAGCAIDPDQSSSGGCTLPHDGSTSRALVNDLAPGTTELQWQYQLNLAADQPAGDYSGGTVVFTATATDVADEPQTAPANTAPPTVSGGEAPDYTLVVSDGTWTGSPSSFAYQWQSCDGTGSSCVDVAGAIGSSFAVPVSMAGRTFRVRVTATNTAGSTSATSTVSDVVMPPAPVSTGSPVITASEMREGVQASASNGTWSSTPTSFAYRWTRCDGAGSGCVDIAGATAATYTPVSADVGATLRVRVTATGPAGQDSGTSSATAVVIIARPVASTPLPVISGSPTFGQTLTSTQGTFTGAVTSYRYRWQRCDAAGASCIDIPGTISSFPTYRLTSADISSTVRAVVIATNGGGSTTATSEASSMILSLAGAYHADVVSDGAEGLWQLNESAGSTTAVNSVTGGGNLTLSGGSATFGATGVLSNDSAISFPGDTGAVLGGASAPSPDGSVSVEAWIKTTDASSGSSHGVVLFAGSSVGLFVADGEVMGYNWATGTPVSTGVGVADGQWHQLVLVINNSVQRVYVDGRLRASGAWGMATLSGNTVVVGNGDVIDNGQRFNGTIDEVSTYGQPLTAAQIARHYGTAIGVPYVTTLPSVDGLAQVGEQLTASLGEWANGATDYDYQWQRCDSAGASCTTIAGATSATYTVSGVDVDATIRVTVTASNSQGASVASSDTTAVVVGPPQNLVLPTTGFGPQQGVEDTSTDGSWSGNPTTLSYQWGQCDAMGLACLPISGATGAHYTPEAGDVGRTLRLTVTATNALGSSSATSAASVPVLIAAPVNVTQPLISPSTPQQGSPTTVTTGSWSNSPASYAYQWQRCSSVGDNCVAISGATSATYTPGIADANRKLLVRVTATNAGGSATASSNPSNLIPIVAPTNTALPVVSGGAAPGYTLAVSDGSWTSSPSSFAYQWQSCDGTGSSCGDVAGATASSYAVPASLAGRTFRARVTATNTAGSTSAVSVVSGVVMPPAPVSTGLPVITASEMREGVQASASNGTWSTTPTSYAYRWTRCDGAGAGCSDIAGATAATYTPVGADVGATLRVRVTATGPAGQGTATSDASSVVVMARPVASTPLPVISGLPTIGQTLSATQGTFTGAVASYAYRWRRCDAAGASCADIAGASGGASTYVLTAADVDSTLRVVVTATNAGGSATATSAASLVILSLAGAYHAGVVSDGAEGLWRLNESAGSTTAVNSIAGGGNLTLSGGSATFGTAGVLSGDSAITFPGNTAALLGGAPAPTADSSLSAEAWIKTTDPSTNGSYHAVVLFLGSGVGLFVVNGNLIGYNWATATPVPTGVSVVDGQWHQVVVVINSSVQSIYIDGRLRATGAWSKVTLGGNTVVVGNGNAADNGQRFNGTIDEVSTYGQPLTAAQVARHYGTAIGVPYFAIAPSISGVAQVGQQLTADVGQWANGATGYGYQWQRCDGVGANCTDIAGATSATYTPAGVDVASKLRVAVTASNGQGAGVANSDVTAVVVGPPQNLVLPTTASGPQQGVEDTSTDGTWSGSPTTLSYQWGQCDALGLACLPISGATTSRYTPVAGDVGRTLRITVTASNAFGSSSAASAASAPVLIAPPVNVSLPVISPAAPQQGSPMTVTTGSWSNSPSSYAYQWQRCSSVGDNCSAISGATSASYTPGTADAGRKLVARVTATNASGSVTASSNPSNLIPVVAPTNTVLPVVSGGAAPGYALAVTDGTWTSSPSSFAYQWQSCDGAGSGCADVSGATSSSYAVPVSLAGRTFRARVTATNTAGSTSATSAVSAVIIPAAPVSTGLPVITASEMREGVQASASNGTWSTTPTSFAYRWTRCDGAGAGCSDIAGATAATYTPVSADVGATLRVRVTATGPAGQGTATSSATAVVIMARPVASTPLPVISGSPTIGQTLSSSQGTFTGVVTSYAYRWRRCDAAGASCADIAGAPGGAATYVLTSTDVDKTLRVVVTATNAGGSATATSAASPKILSLASAYHGGVLSDGAEGLWRLNESAGSTTAVNSVAGGGSLTMSGGSATFGAAGLLSGDTAITFPGTNGAVLAGTTAPSPDGSLSVEAWIKTTDTSAVDHNVVVLPGAFASLSIFQGSALGIDWGSLTQLPTGVAVADGQWHQLVLVVDSPMQSVYVDGRLRVTGTWSSAAVVNPNTVVVGNGSVTDSGGRFNGTIDEVSTYGQPLTAAQVAAHYGMALGAPYFTTAPSISGVAKVGQVLTSNVGDWANGVTAYGYQWQRCDGAGASCTNIAGATGATYTPTDTDLDVKLRITVTSSNGQGSGLAISAATATVVGAPKNLVLPSITDAPQQGVNGASSDGSWAGNPTAWSYQWSQCDAMGLACLTISGATDSHYSPVAADVGRTLRITVTASNAFGSSSATSAASAPVLIAPPVNVTVPVISPAVPVTGTPMTVTTGSWSNSPTSYAYQWQRCSSVGDSCASISGATSTSYTPAVIDFNRMLQVLVTATNSAGSATVTSSLSGVVTSNPPVNTVAPAISGTAAEFSVLTTTNGTWTNSPTFTYQWLRCDINATNCVNIVGATASSYTLVNADVGKRINVRVTATSTGGSAIRIATAAPVTTLGTYQAAVMADTPVALWDLNETTTTTGSPADDRMGTHDGIFFNQSCNSTTPASVAPLATGLASDKALKFNATSSGCSSGSYVYVPTFTLGTAFTIEMWINGANPRADGFRGAGTGDANYVFSGTTFSYRNGSGTQTTLSYPAAVTANTTTYLVATYNGTQMNVYKNGVATPIATSTPGNAPVWVSSNNMVVGVDNSAGTTSDTIDEPALYTHVLTTAQMQQHYLHGTLAH